MRARRLISGGLLGGGGALKYRETALVVSSVKSGSRSIAR